MAAGTSEQTRHRGLAVDQRGKMRSSARERRAVLLNFTDGVVAAGDEGVVRAVAFVFRIG